MTLQSLIAASKLLSQKLVELGSEPLPVWLIVRHARQHIDKQIEVELGRAA